MENMDGTVIATSLPAIAADLHKSPIVLKLALTSYMLTLAVFIPASGWIADRFGARSVFCSAIVVFTLGSVLCGASTSLATLIHHESASRGRDDHGPNRARFLRDQAALLERHGAGDFLDPVLSPWRDRVHSEPARVALDALPPAR